SGRELRPASDGQATNEPALRSTRRQRCFFIGGLLSWTGYFTLIKRPVVFGGQYSSPSSGDRISVVNSFFDTGALSRRFDLPLTLPLGFLKLSRLADFGGTPIHAPTVKDS